MTSIHFRAMPLEKKQEFINSFDTIVTDCDGVIWNALGIIKGAPETLNQLKCRGKHIYYLTNNSTKTTAQILQKFEKLGFYVSEPDILLTSALTATYLKNVLPVYKSVYVVGTNAVCEELQKYKIESSGPGKEEMYDGIFDDLNQIPIKLESNVGAVVVGFDPYISYVKMMKAATYLKDKSCLFVSTNTDETFPSGTSYVMPGAGAILAGIKVASGREPFVIGKPSTYLVDVLTKYSNIDPKRTLFIGDRCTTDILMGKRCGFKTLLVLSGVHSLDDVRVLEESKVADDRLSVPDYYTESVTDLLFD